MAAAGALRVEGVDGGVAERRARVLVEPGLVEGVGVDRDLHVILVRHLLHAADRRGRGAPVLVDLQPRGAGHDLLDRRLRLRGVALAQDPDVHGQPVGGLQHPPDVPRAGRAGGALGALGRAGAAAEQGGHAVAQRLVDLLWRDVVDVGVHAAGGDDLVLARHDLGAGADHQVRVHAVLQVWVTGLAHGHDPAVAHPDVALDHAQHRVHDDRAGDHQVERARGPRAGRVLRHAVADRLAAAVHGLVAVAAAAVGGHRVVVGRHLDRQHRVRQPQTVTDGGSVDVRVGRAREHGRRALGHGHGVARRAHLVVVPFPLLVQKALLAHPLQRTMPHTGVIERTVDEAGEAVTDARAGEVDEPHRPRLAGLEPHRQPRADRQAPPVRREAIEAQLPVGLEEVVVRAHLHGAVAGVGHAHLDRAAARAEGDVSTAVEVVHRSGHGAPKLLVAGAGQCACV